MQFGVQNYDFSLKRQNFMSIFFYKPQISQIIQIIIKLILVYGFKDLGIGDENLKVRIIRI